MQPEESADAIRKLCDYLNWNQSQMGQAIGASRNLVSMMAKPENPRKASRPVELLLKGLIKKHPQAFADGEAEDAPPPVPDQPKGREALKRAREKTGLTVKEAAKALHYSVKVYQDIEEGGSNMSAKMARKAAELFGVPVEDLLDGADEPPVLGGMVGTVGTDPGVRLPPGVRARYVPLLSWAECGRMVAFEDTAYTHEGFLVFDPQDRKAFALQLSGDSMSPLYGPGDTAIVYPSHTARNGDLVIARLKEDFGGDVMFKIYQASGDIVKLSSYNPHYPPMDFDKAQFTWIYPVDQINKKLRKSC